MTKKELLNRYQEVLNEKKEAFEADKVEKSKKISKKEAEFYGEVFLDLIMDTVAIEDLKLVGFGNFERKFKEGKTGTINVGPKKGEEYNSVDHFAIGFKAGKVFKDKVNGIVSESGDEVSGE